MIKKLLSLVLVFQSLFCLTQDLNLIWANYSANSGGLEPIFMAVDTLGNVFIAGSFQDSIDIDFNASIDMHYSNGERDFFVAYYSHDGAYLWGKTIGGTGRELIEDIDTDDQGNVFVVGTFEDSVDFDPGSFEHIIETTNTENNMFILSLDSFSEFRWVQTNGLYSGLDQSIRIGTNSIGDVFIGSDHQGQLEFYTGEDTLFFDTDSLSDVFITKYSYNGNWQWTEQIISPDRDILGDMIIGYEDQIYFCGYDYPTSNPTDTIHLKFGKLDSSGSIVFIKSFLSNGNLSSVNGIAVDEESNIYITGGVNSTTDFDPSESEFIMNIPFWSCFMAKYDENGNFISSDFLTSTEGSVGRKMAYHNGRIYLQGEHYGELDADPSDDEFVLEEPTINFDSFVLCLDTAMQFQWAFKYGSYWYDLPYGIWPYSSEEIYVAGSFLPDGFNYLDLDPSSDEYFIPLEPNSKLDYGWTPFFVKISNCPDSEIELVEHTCDSYTAPDGAIYTESGTYNAIIPTSEICSINYTIDLTVGTPNFSNASLVACEPYTWNDMVYDSSGIYQQTFINASGCDSIATIELEILQPDEMSTNESVCGEYLFGDSTYTSSGIYEHVFTNSHGCDSLVVLDLEILPIDESHSFVSSCTAYEWQGNTYDTSGEHIIIFTNQYGCDSILSLDLEIVEVDVNVINETSISLLSEAIDATFQWLNCDNNYAPASGATNAFFSPYPDINNTSWAVEVTQSGCVDTSDCFLLSWVGVETLERNVWYVYPNPFDEFFYIDSRTGAPLNQVLITDAQGRIIADLRNIPTHQPILIREPSGVYFLHLITDEQREVVKILKL